jgi:hypothetical protein
LHSAYLLGETNVLKIVRDRYNSIRNYLRATEISEKTEDDWANTATDFYGRTQFPNYTGVVDAKHIRFKMPSGSVLSVLQLQKLLLHFYSQL